MSHIKFQLHGRTRTIEIYDGKGLLDYFLDFDNQIFYYTVGKQIHPKPFSPRSKRLLELIGIVENYVIRNGWPPNKPSIQKRKALNKQARIDRLALFWSIVVLVVLYLIALILLGEIS